MIVWYLSAYKKSTSSLPSFLRYCKDITSLLFWVFWAFLAMTSRSDTTNLQNTLMLIFMQKIIFIPRLFLEILQRYCKLVILGIYLGYAWSRPPKATALISRNGNMLRLIRASTCYLNNICIYISFILVCIFSRKALLFLFFVFVFFRQKNLSSDRFFWYGPGWK